MNTFADAGEKSAISLIEAEGSELSASRVATGSNALGLKAGEASSGQGLWKSCPFLLATVLHFRLKA
jgi:hypothetical protein